MLENIVLFLAGIGVGAVGWALLHPAPSPPVPPVPHPPEALAEPVTSPDLALTHLRVATAVLEVADRLTSRELCHRLADALQSLSGIVIIEPVVGTPFDPDKHTWESTEAPTGTALAETVAATVVAGIVDNAGGVRRKARVAVFD